MIAARDATATLRKVSALRALCLRLPHRPASAEHERLQRFQELVTSPEGVTTADVETLVAGWRQWWRTGDVEVLSGMAGRLPAGYVDNDRRLAGLSLAAALTLWNGIQEGIWRCTACAPHPRVEVNVTQQTDAPSRPCTLLLVSLAPPHTTVTCKTKATSATNAPDDALRRFLERALDLSWTELTARGLVLLHAVKCAIRPNHDGFQNPPSTVVDVCAPQHLSREIHLLKPPIVATLGTMAYRAVVQGLTTITGAARDANLRLSAWPSDAGSEGQGHDVLFPGGSFRLFTGPFIRGPSRYEAAKVVRRAATMAGIRSDQPG